MNSIGSEILALMGCALALLIGVVRAERDGLFRTLGMAAVAYLALRIADLTWTPVLDAVLAAQPELDAALARPLTFAGLFLAAWLPGVIVVWFMPHEGATFPSALDSMGKLACGVALGGTIALATFQALMFSPTVKDAAPRTFLVARAACAWAGQNELPTHDDMAPPSDANKAEQDAKAAPAPTKK